MAKCFVIKVKITAQAIADMLTGELYRPQVLAKLPPWVMVEKNRLGIAFAAGLIMVSVGLKIHGISCPVTIALVVDGMCDGSLRVKPVRIQMADATGCDILDVIMKHVEMLCRSVANIRISGRSVMVPLRGQLEKIGILNTIKSKVTVSDEALGVELRVDNFEDLLETPLVRGFLTKKCEKVDGGRMKFISGEAEGSSVKINLLHNGRIWDSKLTARISNMAVDHGAIKIGVELDTDIGMEFLVKAGSSYRNGVMTVAIPEARSRWVGYLRHSDVSVACNIENEGLA